jgi:glycerol kinase
MHVQRRRRRRWQLTGGAQFATDVTNASRTLLMNVHTLAWDEGQLRALGVPRCMLPEIRSSSEVRRQSSS